MKKKENQKEVSLQRPDQFLDSSDRLRLNRGYNTSVKTSEVKDLSTSAKK